MRITFSRATTLRFFDHTKSGLIDPEQRFPLSNEPFLIQTDFQKLEFLNKEFSKISLFYQERQTTFSLNQVNDYFKLTSKLLVKAESYLSTLEERKTAESLSPTCKKTNDYFKTLIDLIKDIDTLKSEQNSKLNKFLSLKDIC